jgi:hypothetical protein
VRSTSFLITHGHIGILAYRFINSIEEWLGIGPFRVHILVTFGSNADSGLVSVVLLIPCTAEVQPYFKRSLT